MTRIRTLLLIALAPALLVGAIAGCDAAGESRAAAAAAGASGDAAPPAGDGAWRHAALWDDGNAELCAYEVTWARYGQRWAGTARLITVKEPWAPDLDVKADTARADGFDVLKLNHVRDVRTGIYTYHQMASAFARRDSGALVKLATTSSEACGISTATVVDGTLESRSYFDGQGARSQPYPAAALPEDALALHLRDYVAGPTPPATVEVFPTLLTGRFPELAATSYRLTRRAGGPLTVPAGELDAIDLVLEAGDRRLVYSFETAPPHRLLRLLSSDGTEYRLAKCERLPYWDMARPGAEAWYPESVR